MKPILPKGTRDYSPIEVSRRNYMKEKIKLSYEKYGFEPIETPSFEKLEILKGNYSEEGDRLIFKILNSGEKLKKADIQSLKSNKISQFSNSISEKALRYDLTIPFARYVSKNQNEINFPFKRYQIQPVWRADRPQYGRFQEFIQCDADIIGSNSLLLEVDLILLCTEVFKKLGLESITIKINHRKILYDISKKIGFKNNFKDFTTILDKFNKIGSKGVIDLLRKENISSSKLSDLKYLLTLDGSNEFKLKSISKFLGLSFSENSGLNDIDKILKNKFIQSSVDFKIDFDLTLARGLDYYTGSIFEISCSKNDGIGSIGGGGRYDNLASTFGLKNMSGVGISLGFDRIYLLMDELDLFPEFLSITTQVLIANFGTETEQTCMDLLKKLRSNEIRSEFYPDFIRINNQLSYADKKNIPYVIMIGKNELESKVFLLKDLKKREQSSHSINEILSVINKKIG